MQTLVNPQTIFESSDFGCRIQQQAGHENAPRSPPAPIPDARRRGASLFASVAACRRPQELSVPGCARGGAPDCDRPSSAMRTTHSSAEMSAWRVALGNSVVRHGRAAITGVRESTRRSVRRIIMHIIRCRQEDRMRATRIMANLRVADVEATKGFYTDYLGLSTEEFNMGWVARYTSPDTGANVQLVTRDATAPEDSVISVHTDDVEGAYERAQRLGYEIVHPITTEPWGVRRFFVRAPDGNVINIANHRE
jgi:predicted enzyme related to lactoylglutathione lyase